MTNPNPNSVTGKENDTGKLNLFYINVQNYEGGWKNGKPHGHGVSTSTNGNKYDGEWKDGKPHGRGVSTRANDGRKYDGEWKDGKQHRHSA